MAEADQGYEPVLEIRCDLLGLDGQTPGIVDSVEEERRAQPLEVFVDGLAGALKVAVVIDDQDAAGDEPGVEHLELLGRGLIPVRIQA